MDSLQERKHPHAHDPLPQSPTPPPPPATAARRKSFSASVFSASSRSFDPVAVFYILAWFTANVVLVVYNKALVQFYGFRFPIFTTSLHMLVCSIGTFIVLNTPAFDLQVPTKRQTVSIVALTLFFCLSVVFGNMSFLYVSLAFNQIVGAATPIFTTLVSAAIGRYEGLATYVSLLPIVGGVILSVKGEIDFNLTGFLFCFSATIFRAIKTVTQSLLLKKGQPDSLTSLNLLLYMSTLSFMILFPFVIRFEGDVLHAHGFKTLGAVAGSGLVAFAVNFLGFQVTKHTSALTLQVAGSVKLMLAIFLSSVVFSSEMSWTSIIGCLTTCVGVVCYIFSKNVPPPAAVGKGHDHEAGKNPVMVSAPGPYDHLSAAPPRPSRLNKLAVMMAVIFACWGMGSTMYCMDDNSYLGDSPVIDRTEFKRPRTVIEDYGVLFVLDSHNNGQEELAAAARSADRLVGFNGGLDVTLVTDLVVSPEHTRKFSRVVGFSENYRAAASETSAARFAKGLMMTPYRKTLFLSPYAYACSDISGVFASMGLSPLGFVASPESAFFSSSLVPMSADFTVYVLDHRTHAFFTTFERELNLHCETQQCCRLDCALEAALNAFPDLVPTVFAPSMFVNPLPHSMLLNDNVAMIKLPTEYADHGEELCLNLNAFAGPRVYRWGAGLQRLTVGKDN